MSGLDSLKAEIQKLAPSAVIELFELDATALGGEVLRFHAGTNGLNGNITWQGETYIRFPVACTGFEFTGQGQFPRPKISVANVYSVITTVLLEYDDLLGAKVTRKRTMAKFLDAVNFPGGVNATADATAEFPDDVYYIDRKSSEDRDMVEFELAASVDLAGVALPRRQIIQNLCIWQYRGSDCGYAGAPLWDEDDDLIATTPSAEGQAVIDAYQDKLSTKAALDAAEATLKAAAVAKWPACEYQFEEQKYEVVSNFQLTSGILRDRWGNQSFKWNGGNVTLGLEYRQGPQTSTDAHTYTHWAIQKWSIDSAACTAATNTYNSALTARNTAKTNYDNAVAALAAALADLPEDDPIYSQERCGKRLSSCKARFGENAELPFGGFPASGLIK
jgi:lambda family phage minor tail protein L